jgi:hypothetical protein
MTVNLNRTPNSIHLQGDTSFHHHFGAVHSVTPVCLGMGHTAHVDVRFVGGVKMEFSPDAVAELARRFPEALASLPFIPELHDAVGGE